MKRCCMGCSSAQAGLLEPALLTSSPVVEIPKEIPIDLGALMVRMAGPPPWDEELYARMRAEYDREGICSCSGWAGSLMASRYSA